MTAHLQGLLVIDPSLTANCPAPSHRQAEIPRRACAATSGGREVLRLPCGQSGLPIETSAVSVHAAACKSDQVVTRAPLWFGSQSDPRDRSRDVLRGPANRRAAGALER